jgi:hypothetical protein
MVLCYNLQFHFNLLDWNVCHIARYPDCVNFSLSSVLHSIFSLTKTKTILNHASCIICSLSLAVVASNLVSAILSDNKHWQVCIFALTLSNEYRYTILYHTCHDCSLLIMVPYEMTAPCEMSVPKRWTLCR